MGDLDVVNDALIFSLLAKEMKMARTKGAVAKQPRIKKARHFHVTHGNDEYLAKAFTQSSVRKFAMRGTLSIRKATDEDLLDNKGEVIDLTRED